MSDEQIIFGGGRNSGKSFLMLWQFNALMENGYKARQVAPTCTLVYDTPEGNIAFCYLENDQRFLVPEENEIKS